VPQKTTATEVPSLTPIPSSEAVWVDNFDRSVLGDAWVWIGNDPSHWSLTARPGHFMITTTSNSGPGDPVNELLQPLPAGDFSIHTRLSFNPSQDFHFAGLIVLRNGDNFVRLGELYSGADGGQLVSFDKKQSGVWSDLYVNRPDLEFVYLRIDRFGSTFDGYLSTDGIDWILLGSHTVQFTPTRIGLYTGDGRQNTEEIPALFDYFLIQR
jgi:beta-xylosidase